jgi:type IV pilus assembly protein PilY1
MKKKITILLATAGMLSVLIAASSARAEDIDLYANDNGNTNDVPNVLIVIDNAADFSKSNLAQPCTYADGTGSPSLDTQVAGMIQCALVNAVNSLPVGSVNLGVMFYSGPVVAGCVGNQGGCLAQPLALLTKDYRDAFIGWVKGWTNTTVKANSETTGAVMQEAWAYYAGSTGISGRSYAGVKPPAGCQKNFVVYIGNSFTNNTNPNDNGSGVPAAALQSAPGVTTALMTPITNIAQPKTVSCTVNSGEANLLANHVAGSGLWADEWARYMHQTDLYGNFDGVQTITTYAIGILGANCLAIWPTLMNSMALQGGGAYYSAYSNQDLFNALGAIFNEVQAINSVFASASLPVSVNTQGTYLNQIYVGVFRPDANDKPRWLGNLKQYQFGVDLSVPTTPQLFLADATGARALAAAGTGTGFISPNAISFWTSKDTSTLPDNISANGGFWINNQQGPGLGFDKPDGQFVEKGAVSQRIRLTNLINDYTATAGSTAAGAYNPRLLFTCIGPSGDCSNGNSLSGMPFAPANTGITDVLLGTGTGAIGVTSFSRSGTTITVTLASAPSPAIVIGQSINIIGASTGRLNGAQTVTGVPSPTQFTFALAELPPSPSNGTYRAAKTASNPKLITSLTRNGTTVTAIVANHGYTQGQFINISGADPATSGPYNGSYAVTIVDSNTFRYTITDGPSSPASGGTATVGSQTAAISTITRTSTTGNTTAVTFTASANLNSAFQSIGASVTISGAPAGYNGTFSISNYQNNPNNSCPNGQNNKSFCITGMPTTPAATAIAASGSTLTADNVPSYSVSFTHPAANCPSTNLVTVLASAPGHTFVDGDSVMISGAPASDGNAYLGTFTISGVVSGTSFNIANFATSPPCAPSATGASVITNPSAVNKSALINWVRGQDSTGDELTPQSNGINVRGSVHGDVLHSRPAVVNYGTGKIVAFYGSNDGVFRAVNANQTGAIGTSRSFVPGEEMWGFIAPEFFSRLSRQYLNSPLVKLFSTPTNLIPTPTQKPYFFDGDVGVYQNSDNSKVYIYLTARRGGRLIYALDVTDPVNPKFLWKKGCPILNASTNTNVCSTDFDELGQTWSAPKVITVAGYSNPLVVFGAGYDANEDNDPPSTADTMGRGIYMLDAFDGHVVFQAKPGPASDPSRPYRCTDTPCTLPEMTYAMPADVTLVDRNFDGMVDRMYAGDTGGNIWRVDLETPGGNDPSKWIVTKFAALGGTGSANKRKFLYSPDIVLTRNFDIILGATGDREHPLRLNTGQFSVINRFYGLLDPNNGIGSNLQVPPIGWTPITDSTNPTVPTDFPPNPATDSTGLFNCTSCVTGGATYNGSGRGYFVQLLAGSSVASGEKGVNQASSIGGYTYFSTNAPKSESTTSCESNLGTARGYKIGTFTGTVAVGTFEGGGLPPSPVVGLVTVTFPGADHQTTVPFLIGGANPGGSGGGGDTVSPIGGQIPTITVNPKRTRKYWYLEHDK